MAGGCAERGRFSAEPPPIDRAGPSRSSVGWLAMPALSMDSIVSLCKRRGFIFPGSAVYGGLANSWDYGPLGVELKNNVKRAWWRSVVYERDDMDGLDSAIIMNRMVWKHSGHEATFSDPLFDCRTCKARSRADDVFTAQRGVAPKNLDEVNTAIREKQLTCPKCAGRDLTDARPFNLMFRTALGAAAEGEEGLAYLRPETAQGIFMNFQHVVGTMRRKLPFGIAQVGKAFRNEITPGNFTFRTREFEQMEIEYFVRPGDDERSHEEWIQSRVQWYRSLGLRSENLRMREQTKDELAHYAKRCVDLEYKFPMGWSELEGIANRTDFDLRQHSRGPDNPHSIENLVYHDQETNERFTPYVIEPSAGADRATLAFLCDAYEESLVKEPPAADVDKLKALIESMAKSVSKREELDTAAKERVRAQAESIVADLPGSLPRISSLLSGHGPVVEGLEMTKKVRGVAEKIGEEYTRTVLALHPSLAPVKVAVFPLKKNEPKIVELARGLKATLQKAGLRTVYDDGAGIGKLYRRQDEIGTPFCITVDFKSLEDGTVTLRDRDTMGQERVSSADLAPALAARIGPL
jgi:glycyl-tRNA synthetase